MSVFHPGLGNVFQQRNTYILRHVLTRLTRRVPLVEQKLLTVPEHLSSPPVFSGVRDGRSLILCVCFVDRCFSFCTFSFGHCVVCSSMYRFWLPPFGIYKLSKDIRAKVLATFKAALPVIVSNLWYLQTKGDANICDLTLFCH